MPWVAALLAVVVGVVVWLGPAWRPRPLAGVTRPRPWALGHRGVRGTLPENTVAALEAALAAGLDGVEVDVQRTRDGELVLHHDAEAEGLRIVDHDLAALRARVPDLATFDELVAVVRRYPGTLLNVEVKVHGARDRGLGAAVAHAVRASGLADRVVVSSFHPLALASAARAAPELRRGFLWADPPALPRWLRGGWPGAWLHVDAVHPHHRLVTPEAVARWHRRRLLVNTWTVNDASEVRRVRAAGVDGIIADDPHALLRAFVVAAADETPKEVA